MRKDLLLDRSFFPCSNTLLFPKLFTRIVNRADDKNNQMAKYIFNISGQWNTLTVEFAENITKFFFAGGTDVFAATG